MKRLLPILILLLMFLGACSRSIFPTPSTPSSSGVIQNAVAQTLTALPSQTPAVISSTPLPIQPPTEPPVSTTPAPTSTPQPPAPQTIIVIYPTAIIYVPPVVYPTPIPVWSPAYADQFVQYYFQRINARDYTTTWSLLTEAFKNAVNGETTGGFTGYSTYWNSVQRVDIQSVSVTSWSTNYATVLVNMTYFYLNGYINASTQVYHLYFDAWRSTWMFDSAAAALATPIPTPVPPTLTPPASPADFIYYYFNNLNLRNYWLTWSLLSPSFIANNNSPAQGGYAGYVDFWDSVTRVDITFVTVNSNSGGYSDVTVGLVYNYRSGLITTGSPVYHLLYNYTLGTWQFYSP
jgi:hypothetical protein